MNKIVSKYISRILLVCLVCGFAVFQGCKSSRDITGSDYSKLEGDSRYDNIVEGYTDWKTLSISGKATIKAGAQLSSSIQIKMVKDEIIMISVRPMLGIEIAKLYLKKDSIVFIDKYNKLYVDEDLTALTNKLPFTLSTIQNMILNRAFLLDGTTMSAKTKKQVKLFDNKDGSLIITPKEQMPGFVYSFITDAENNITNLQVVQFSNSKTYNAEYRNFKLDAPYKMAEYIGMETIIGNKNIVLNLNLNASKARWNEPVDTDIELSKKYRKTTLKTYMELFNKR